MKSSSYSKGGLLVIDVSSLFQSLNSKLILRKRGSLFGRWFQRKLSKDANQIKSEKSVSIDKAQQYIRDSIKLKVSIMLKDKGLDAITLDPKSSPITYKLFSDKHGLVSCMEGDTDDA